VVFFENITLKHKRRISEPSSQRFQDADVSACQLSNLPPSCKVSGCFILSKQTNEGTEEVRSPAQTDSSWQQEDLAVAELTDAPSGDGYPTVSLSTLVELTCNGKRAERFFLF